MKFKALVIIGQTASGKTSLAHNMFEKLSSAGIDSELVNLDAFQIYKDVSIGTAKPTTAEQIKYHYHGIDLCESNGFMDANLFAAYLHDTCQKIYNEGKLPICVGGSGLYLRAFLHGLDEFPTSDSKIRNQIREYAQQYGWDKCYERLQHIDPTRAAELHPNDHVRIERALEIYEITQTPPSKIQSKKDPLHAQKCLFDAFVIETEIEAEFLKESIKERTKKLFLEGWIQEVENLYQKYGNNLLQFNSMRAIGYPTILKSIISQELRSYDELIEQINRETKQYAKRQKTWNKKERIDYRINPLDLENISALNEKTFSWFKNST